MISQTLLDGSILLDTRMELSKDECREHHGILGSNVWRFGPATTVSTVHLDPDGDPAKLVHDDRPWPFDKHKRNLAENAEFSEFITGEGLRLKRSATREPASSAIFVFDKGDRDKPWKRDPG